MCKKPLFRYVSKISTYNPFLRLHSLSNSFIQSLSPVSFITLILYFLLNLFMLIYFNKYIFIFYRKRFDRCLKYINCSEDILSFFLILVFVDFIREYFTILSIAFQTKQLFFKLINLFHNIIYCTAYLNKIGKLFKYKMYTFY